MEPVARNPVSGAARIYAYLKEHPEGCTLDELTSGVGVSYNTASQYLHRLGKSGVVVRHPVTFRLNETST